MTVVQWVIDITLVLIVLRQIQETKIDWLFVAVPAVIVALTSWYYLEPFEITTPNMTVLAICATIGLLTGIVGGMVTKVRVEDGIAYAKAGLAAASIWVVSMGARLAFIIWATHGSGQETLRNFSIDHSITSGNVYQTSLVILALSEVVVRFAVILYRGWKHKKLDNLDRRSVPIGG